MKRKTIVTRVNRINEVSGNTECHCSLADELQIIKSVQNGGAEREIAVEKLTQIRLRLVTAVAKRYANRGLTMAKLLAAGNRGLVFAAENFDASKGFKFISYAVWWVRQSVEDEIGKC